VEQERANEASWGTKGCRHAKRMGWFEAWKGSQSPSCGGAVAALVLVLVLDHARARGLGLVLVLAHEAALCRPSKPEVAGGGVRPKKTHRGDPKAHHGSVADHVRVGRDRHGESGEPEEVEPHEIRRG
jgi:hypothetical protein